MAISTHVFKSEMLLLPQMWQVCSKEKEQTKNSKYQCIALSLHYDDVTLQALNQLYVMSFLVLL